MTCRAILFAAVLVSLTGNSAGWADAPPAAPPPDWAAARSAHEMDLEAWNAREAAGWIPWGDPQGFRPSPLRVRRSAAPSHEVHGYHPYWMGSSYLGYDWSQLTTVAFFSLELDGAGAITNDHGWPWAGLVSEAHTNGVRVLVTATLFSGAGIDSLLSDPGRRGTAISNLVAETLAGGADGVNVDFEGVPGIRKQDLVTFLGELQDSLLATVPNAYLSIATPAVDWADAFDYDELAARCDHLMVMAYNYHWSGSATTGPVAPLGGWGTYNVDWTVQDYLTWGAPPASLLLGVPYYGLRWPSATSAAGSATVGTAVSQTYANAQPAALANGPRWDASSSTPWYCYQSGGWFQGWYEDSSSVAAKYGYVLQEGLAGAGIWALGYDGGFPELWGALAAAFGNATAVVPGPAPSVAALSLAGPNPFREHAHLRLSLPAGEPFRLSVHDPAGRRVRDLMPAPGASIVAWDGRDLSGRAAPAGVYFVRLQAGDLEHAVRIVRLR